MKKLVIFSIFFLSAFFVFAERPVAEGFWIDKKKVITKTYPLRSDQKVSITNSFGEVAVNNWNRNEVKVEITIRVSANNEKKAQEILDQIRIEENSGKEISFETKIGANGANNSRVKTKNNDSKMEINYVVTLPAQAPLYIKNSFGNTFIPDRKGATEIRQSFGNFTAGNLTRDADIKVEFGKLIANGIDGSKIKSSYSEVNIKKLAGDLKTSFEFCKKLELGLSNDIEALTVNASYSDLKILVPGNFNGNFRIKTSFGKAQSGTLLKLNDETKEPKYGPAFDRIYTGKSGNGKTVILINSSFGNVSFD